jgi:CRP/FNR family transcriptional regulator, cyclic AMP receptor protein
MDPARLTSNQIFSDLDADQLERLAALATQESHPIGVKLVREGDFSTELYVIEEGTADVVRGGKTVDTVGSGDIVGEIGVLGKSKRTADVIATTPLLVIKITHWEIRRLSAETIAKLTAIVDARTARD